MNILVDFDKRSDDKTNGNVLILGNSGHGKSYMLKLILTNIRESGKSIICLDPEAEFEELTNNLGGCYIAFLKDFFRTYKDFSDRQLDTIEILLTKLYETFGITDETDYSTKKPSDFPVMSDLYKLCEEEYQNFDSSQKHLYDEEMLKDILLGIHSMCVGSESKYFNGHTNITDSKFLCFGVKGLMETNQRLKDVRCHYGKKSDEYAKNTKSHVILLSDTDTEISRQVIEV